MIHLTVIEHNQLRVLTTKQLADSYGTDVKAISKNFNNNIGRYVHGKHYFLLENDELRAFLTFYELPENINKLYLWTEKGAWLHAKSLGTDEAWEAYEALAASNQQIITNIKDTLAPTDKVWRKYVNDMLARVARSRGNDYKGIKEESYALLEKRASCNLTRRVKNLKDRLREAGRTKTTVERTTRLDVIEEDKRLKEIYTAIVRELSIKYVA